MFLTQSEDCGLHEDRATVSFENVGFNIAQKRYTRDESKIGTGKDGKNESKQSGPCQFRWRAKSLRCFVDILRKKRT